MNNDITRAVWKEEMRDFGVVTPSGNLDRAWSLMETRRLSPSAHCTCVIRILAATTRQTK